MGNLACGKDGQIESASLHKAQEEVSLSKLLAGSEIYLRLTGRCSG
jgi:hypothetical protein